MGLGDHNMDYKCIESLKRSAAYRKVAEKSKRSQPFSGTRVAQAFLNTFVGDSPGMQDMVWVSHRPPGHYRRIAELTSPSS